MIFDMSRMGIEKKNVCVINIKNEFGCVAKILKMCKILVKTICKLENTKHTHIRNENAK